jgi:hypothetical protein
VVSRKIVAQHTWSPQGLVYSAPSQRHQHVVLGRAGEYGYREWRPLAIHHPVVMHQLGPPSASGVLQVVTLWSQVLSAPFVHVWKPRRA